MFCCKVIVFALIVYGFYYFVDGIDKFFDDGLDKFFDDYRKNH